MRPTDVNTHTAMSLTAQPEIPCTERKPSPLLKKLHHRKAGLRNFHFKSTGCNIILQATTYICYNEQCMKFSLVLSVLLFTEVSASHSQIVFPQEKINQALDGLSKSNPPVPSCNVHTEKLQGSPARFFQQFPYGQSIPLTYPENTVRDYDTLIIGAVPNDTLKITGA